MIERTFECDLKTDSCKPDPIDCGKKIGQFIYAHIGQGQSATVTVRVNVGGDWEEPVQESVPFAMRLKLEKEKNSGWRHGGPGIWDWINSIPTESNEGVLECTFKPTPKPARVKWPEWLPDVTRVKVSTLDDGRPVAIMQCRLWTKIARCMKDEFGVWPPDQSRIATRTADGYVELSPCES